MPQNNAITDRESFKAYILRNLGSPVLTIEVSDDQVEDKIDQALIEFQTYHYDAVEKVYLAVPVTPDFQKNQYYDLDDDIVAVSNIFQVGGSTYGNNLFDYRYQVALNDLYSLTTQSLIPYYITLQNLQFTQDLLVGQKPIRYNRYNNRIYIDADSAIFEGYIMIECSRLVDPDVYDKIWNDRWLKKYAVALVKQQWGNNLSKFSNTQMPGGVTFDGVRILRDAEQEIEELEQELKTQLTEILPIFIG